MLLSKLCQSINSVDIQSMLPKFHYNASIHHNHNWNALVRMNASHYLHYFHRRITHTHTHTNLLQLGAVIDLDDIYWHTFDVAGRKNGCWKHNWSKYNILCLRAIQWAQWIFNMTTKPSTKMVYFRCVL